jgi:hypothetical protein
MKIKIYILEVLAVASLLGSLTAKVRAEPSSASEYQIKAAFLYNFIQFVDWPEEKSADSNKPIIIGIIGENPFGDAFEPVKNKKVKGRSVIIKRFESFEELKKPTEKNPASPKATPEASKPKSSQEIETLTECHLLFICSSEQKDLKEIINTIKDHSVLTVGEMGGFLEAGGIINWFVDEKKIRFEINVTVAERSKLKIRSELLRLAKRLV